MGQFKDNKRHGRGKAAYTNGAYYSGEWADGEFNGKGRFIWKSGNWFEGDWKNGVVEDGILSHYGSKMLVHKLEGGHSHVHGDSY